MSRKSNGEYYSPYDCGYGCKSSHDPDNLKPKRRGFQEIQQDVDDRFTHGPPELRTKPDEIPLPILHMAMNAVINGADPSLITNTEAAFTKGGIERQEKNGQLRQKELQQLPRDGMQHYRPALERMGFVFDEPAGARYSRKQLFIDVQFPDGWCKKLTDHSMWSDLVDQDGRKRGSIFYKAAFYDESAHFFLNTRFGIRMDTDYDNHKVTVRIHDEMGLIDPMAKTFDKPNFRDGDRAVAEALEKKIERRSEELKSWMKKHYPEWENAACYWDDKQHTTP